MNSFLPSTYAWNTYIMVSRPEKLVNRMFVERIDSKYYNLMLGVRYMARIYVGQVHNRVEYK